jgi:hypothetical protein
MMVKSLAAFLERGNSRSRTGTGIHDAN